MLGISDLDVYKVEKQVHIFVDNKKSSYMIADLILYKEENGRVVDVIIIEIKLRKTTEYTIRQRTTFNNILTQNLTELHTRSVDIRGLRNLQGFPTKNIQLIKIYSRNDNANVKDFVIEKITEI